MPAFLVPLHEFNMCHVPAGTTAGGQFCRATAMSGQGLPNYEVIEQPGKLRIKFYVHPTAMGTTGEKGAGGTILVKLPKDTSEHAYVMTVFVSGSLHGKGYGSKLYRAATEEVQARGYPGIVSKVADRSELASQAWDRMLRRGRVTRRLGLSDVMEFNPCHRPAGNPEGGQFCGKGDWAAGQGRMTKGRRATHSAMHPATDKERRKLAIPPAYTNVMVADNPKAELRATAVSPKTGNTAYFYSKGYKARQQDAKWSRIVAMQQGVEALDARLAKDLSRPGKDAYHTAMTLRLILQTGMRNGTEPDGETFGASNMPLDHVEVHGNKVRFQFPGKGGKAHDLTVTDSLLASYVGERRATGASTLFPHDGADTLSYLKGISRGRFKVHDLRTWYATVYADHLVTQMVEQGLAPSTVKEQKAFRKQVATTVAARLGNTPAMALNTYIHPRVWQQIGWTG